MPIEEQSVSAIGQIDAFGALQLFLTTLGILALILVVLGAITLGVGWAWVIWMRNKNREEKSLDYVLLSIAVPRDNEIKIDAAEQMFSSLYSIYQGGSFSFLKPQSHFSFEIVATPEEIKFYVF